MPDDQTLRECELPTIEDMKSHDNHQCPITACSGDIIKSMKWLMRQPAYAEHLIYSPQHCFHSDTQLQSIYTEMHTADW
jgi:hypothetical protein